MEIAEFEKSILAFVDDAKKINDSWVEVVHRISKLVKGNWIFLTNGLGQQLHTISHNFTRSSVSISEELETICVILTSFVTGTAVSDSDHNNQYFGVVDHQTQEQLGQGNRIRTALLLEGIAMLNKLGPRLGRS